MPTPTATSNLPAVLSTGPVEGHVFTNSVTGISYSGDRDIGTILPATRLSSGLRWMQFEYLGDRDRYVISPLNSMREVQAPIFTSFSEADPHTTTQEFLGLARRDQSPTKVLRLFRYPSANSDVSLFDSSIGHYNSQGPLGHLNFDDAWFAFGYKTAIDDLPGGVAQYGGAAYARALNGDLGKQIELEGNVSLTIDYDARLVWGELELYGTSEDGAIVSTGSIDIGQFGLFNSEAWQFRADIIGVDGQYGSLEGILYGPRGREASGVLELELPLVAGESDYVIKGAFGSNTN